MKKYLILAFAFLAFTLFGGIKGIPDRPESYFNDCIQLTSPAFGTRMNDLLQDFDKRSSCQIVCAVFGPLSEYTESSLEDFAQDVFNQWKPGLKNENNGVLFLLFVDKKTGKGKSRIHVGYGLEGKLTDGKTKLLQQNEMIPFFKQQKWEPGISNVLAGLVAMSEGEYKVKAAPQPADSKKLSSKEIVFLVLIILVVFGLWLWLQDGRYGCSGGWITGGYSGGSSSGSDSGSSWGGGSSGGGGSSSDW